MYLSDSVGNRTVSDLLDEAAAVCPQKTWLVYEDAEGATSEITYQEFQHAVMRLAAGLVATGVAKGDVIALHCKSHPEFLRAWFAIARAGAVVLPINVMSTQSDIRYMVRNARAKAVIAQRSVVPEYQGLEDELGLMFVAAIDAGNSAINGLDSQSEIVSSIDDMATDDFSHLPEDIDSNDLFQLLYTSGTTSKPKAVEHTHATALHAGDRVVKGMGLESDDRRPFMLAIESSKEWALSPTIVA